MKSRSLRVPLRRWLAVALVGGGLGVAACGSATSSSAGAGTSSNASSIPSPSTPPTTTPTGTTTSTAGSGLTVSPLQGGPTTRFLARFVAPSSSGSAGSSRVGYTLSLSGSHATGGCIGARTVPVPSATRGLPIAVALDPASLGGSWCPGTHTARVVEIEGPICNPGMMCPQYLRVVGTVGQASFTTHGTA